MTTTTTGDLLALDGAPTELRRLVEGSLEPHTLELGDELAQEGVVPQVVQVLLHGSVRVVVRGGDGIEIALGRLGPGAVVAAEAASGTPSAVTVRASGPVSTVSLHGSLARSLTQAWSPTAELFRDAASALAPPAAAGSHRRSPRERDDTVEPAPTDLVTTPDAWEGTRSGRRVRRVPLVLGNDEMDCGAATLTAICRSFGHRINFASVRAAVSTAADGTSLLGLHRGAQALGLHSAMVTVSPSRLDDLPLPAMCHIDGNHWVALDRVRRRRVRLMDPLGPSGTMNRADFERRFTGFALLVAPTDRLQEMPVASSAGSFLRPFLTAEWKAITFATVCSAGIAASELAIPLSSKWVIDNVIAPKDTGLLIPLIALVFAVLGLAAALTVLQRYVITRAALRIDRASLDHVAGTLLALPVTFFHSRRTGDIERRLNGLREVRSFFLSRGVSAFVAFFEVVGALVIMAHWDPHLVGVYLAVVPMYAVLMLLTTRRLRPAFASLEESWGRYKSRQIDAIRGVDTIKASGSEPDLRRALARQFDDLAGRLFRADFTIMLYEGALSLVALVPLALFLWLGSYEVVRGDISLGVFVSFVTLVIVVTGPMTQLFSMWDVVQQARVLLDRLGEFVDHGPEQQPGSGTDPGPLVGEVRVDRVHFGYPGATAVPVLDDVSVHAQPGQTVAVVGRSGAGKSTFLHLLAGLIRPDDGTISCDGHDLADVDLRAYRQQLGVVLQDSHLFDATIAENIAFGAETVDETRLTHAARAALAEEFVLRLPLGFGTRVGERGIRLSGGERQRICLARALYRDPAVLLLDEATSALDTESERALQESLRTAAQGRTVFVVAHRLSTVRDADQILVLEEGRIVERGTHDELLARRGIYFELASNQLG